MLQIEPKHKAPEDFRVFVVPAFIYMLTLGLAVAYPALIWLIFPAALLAAAAAKTLDPYLLFSLVISPFWLSKYFSDALGILGVTGIRSALVFTLGFFALMVGNRGFLPALRPTLFLWGALFVLAILCAPYYSLYPDISTLKATFTLLFLGLLLFTAGTRPDFPFSLAALIAAIAFCSAACYFVRPGVGQCYTEFINSELRYSGVMSHPQSMGCFLGLSAPLFLYLFARPVGFLLKGVYASVFAAIVFDVYVSGSRIGALTLITTVSVLLTIQAFSSSMTVRRTSRAALALFSAGLAAVAILAYDSITGFATKGAYALNLSGRDQIIQMSWDGFLHSPFLGNGFQVPSIYTSRGAAQLSTESGTSIEKCFAGTMLLEEVGVVGTALFAAGLFFLLRACLSSRAYLSFVLILGFAVVNLAEATIFSPSSLGGLCWILIFSTYSVSHE